MDSTKLEREMRYLKVYAVASSLLLVVLLAAAFRSTRTQRFTVIDVERINVVEPSGRLAMVVSNGERIPGPILDGEELPRELSSGRRGSAGLMFYNSRGDEVGGLTFRGEQSGDAYSASGMLAFDQFRQDQVVALQYSDGGNRRSAGVNVWDRSTTIGVAELLDLLQSSRGPAGAARDSAAQRLQALEASGTLGAHRIFLGSQNRTAALRISDTLGRTRIRLYVDSTNTARMEFLSESGEVIESWPRSGG
jgi:hypothetical protein